MLQFHRAGLAPNEFVPACGMLFCDLDYTSDRAFSTIRRGVHYGSLQDHRAAATSVQVYRADEPEPAQIVPKLGEAHPYRGLAPSVHHDDVYERLFIDADGGPGVSAVRKGATVARFAIL